MGNIGNLCVLCVLAFFALSTIDFTAEARSNGVILRNVVLRDIPARCINNTVTNVSCNNTDILDNLIPHPDDCQLFYYCVTANLPPVCRQCPAKLHFNPQKRVCDLPERAGCQSNVANSSGDDSADVE